MSELVEISDIPNLLIDLAYAGPDNFVQRAVYAPGAKAALRPEAKKCLEKAALSASKCGLKIIVYDSYRPAQVQDVFWQAIADPRYVADASVGSNHTRGTAVDVSLIDANCNLLDMGTAFDAMCDQSHHDRDDLPEHVQRNRSLLLGIMLHAGFGAIATEWWHYELPDSEDFPLIEQDNLVKVIQITEETK